MQLLKIQKEQYIDLKKSKNIQIKLTDENAPRMLKVFVTLLKHHTQNQIPIKARSRIKSKLN